MRILSIHSCMDPMFGGHENTLFELSRNMASAGIEPFLLTERARTNSEFEAQRMVRQSGCEIVTIPVNARQFSSFFYLLSIFYALKLMWKKNIDLIHVHQVHSALFGYIIRILTGKKLVMEYRGYWRKERLNESISLKSKLIMKIFDALYAFIEGSAFRVSDIIIVNHPTFPQYIIENYHVSPMKIYLIDNGVNLEIYKSKLQQPKFLNNYKGDRLIVQSDHFKSKKGQLNLIKAIPIILSSFPTARFIFPGEGPFITEAKKLVTSLKVDKYVLFTGQLNKQEMASLLLSSDICVSQLVYEPLGLSASHLEPIAAKKPLVTRFDPFIFKIFRDSIYYVKPNDTREIAEVITLLLSDFSARNKAVLFAYEILVNNFSWKKSVERRGHIFKMALMHTTEGYQI